jgi:cytochrome c-type biogenesis protein CcmH
MKKFRLPVIFFAVLLLAVLPATGTYAAVTSKEVESELICQCGCTMIVDVCDCDTANQIRAKIATMIGQGMDKNQILASFAGEYGEQMLAAPPKKGFNLVAWVGPFAAVAAGGTGLLFALRAWARKGKERPDEDDLGSIEPGPVPDPDAYRVRLKDELRKFKEGPV